MTNLIFRPPISVSQTADSNGYFGLAIKPTFCLSSSWTY